MEKQTTNVTFEAKHNYDRLFKLNNKYEGLWGHRLGIGPITNLIVDWFFDHGEPTLFEKKEG